MCEWIAQIFMEHGHPLFRHLSGSEQKGIFREREKEKRKLQQKNQQSPK
jgi:hypothetical protein